MSTTMAKVETVERTWHVVDAAGKPLGRVAAVVAAMLRGKHKVDFTNHVDCGDHVIVINADKVVLTGKKMEQKYYRYHTLYVGGLKEIQYKEMLKNKSDKAVFEAVKGMLPKNRIGRQMIKKLRVYKDANHGHEAQKPEAITLEGKR